MNTQTLTTEVVFRRPFVLGGLDGIQPPGSYAVETYSELLDIPNAVAYRRLSTSIELHAQPAGIIRRAIIDPTELGEALRRDSDPEAMPAATVLQPDTCLSQLTPRRSPTAALAGVKSLMTGHDAVEWRHHVPSRRSEPTGGWRQWILFNTNELTWLALVFGGLLLLRLGS